MKKIKSYVLRAGRISPRQQKGLDEYLQAYELPIQSEPWCFQTLFGRTAPIVLEIGFGMGASLLTMARERPEVNFLGIEVHRAGIGALAADLHEAQLNHVRIACFDACELFKNCLHDDSLDGVQIFFPDPWPKKRHHKRRLIQADFVNLLAQKLKVGGFLHCATDWAEYAEHMLDVLSHEPLLVNQEKNGAFAERPAARPLTKFEQRGFNLGHKVFDLIFVKI